MCKLEWMGMRTRKEILEDEAVIWEGNWQTSGGNKAILEVLLDIRDLLVKQSTPSIRQKIEDLTA
jgi:hypothetical protein